MEQTPVGVRKAVASFNDGTEENRDRRDFTSSIAEKGIAGDARGTAMLRFGERSSLIEAALATDQRIASLDDRVRNHLKEISQGLNELAAICWVNPEKTAERAIEWLEQGAPADRTRMLGYLPPRSSN